MRRLALLIAALLVIPWAAGCTADRSAPAPNPASAPAPPPARRPQLSSVHFTDLLHGRALGSSALTTADGGRTWTVTDPLDGGGEGAPTPPAGLPGNAESWCAAGPATFLAASGYTIQRTVDGGKSWAPAFAASVPRPETGWRSQVQCQGTAAWVLFIGRAAMSKQAYVAYRSPDAGDTWAPILASGYGVPVLPNTQTGQMIDAYAGPFDAMDAQTAIFAGSCPACYPQKASITLTADGGKRWQHHDISGINAVVSLSFVDAQHGWVLAQDREIGSVILATADGGETWQRQYPAGPENNP